MVQWLRRTDLSGGEGRGLLATPASSASSERDFSLLKLSLSKHKCSMKDDIIDSKAVLHSFLDDSA